MHMRSEIPISSVIGNDMKHYGKIIGKIEWDTNSIIILNVDDIPLPVALITKNDYNDVMNFSFVNMCYTIDYCDTIKPCN